MPQKTKAPVEEKDSPPGLFECRLKKSSCRLTAPPLCTEHGEAYNGRKEKNCREDDQMKPDLGGRIALLRKKRNMTQKQLAKALGVSTPAVSKWETNHSCPDISILCPMARALGTSVDTLLLFEEEPDRDEVEKKAKEIVEAGREEGCEKGEALLNAWLHQYPSSASVQYNAAGILVLFGMMFPEKKHEKKEAWLRQRRELLEKIRNGKDETYRGRALHDLAHLELQTGNLTEAERMLEETSQENVDMTMLRVQLYLAKGQRGSIKEPSEKIIHRAGSGPQLSDSDDRRKNHAGAGKGPGNRKGLLRV